MKFIQNRISFLRYKQKKKYVLTLFPKKNKVTMDPHYKTK